MPASTPTPETNNRGSAVPIASAALKPGRPRNGKGRCASSADLAIRPDVHREGSRKNRRDVSAKISGHAPGRVIELVAPRPLLMFWLKMTPSPRQTRSAKAFNRAGDPKRLWNSRAATTPSTAATTPRRRDRPQPSGSTSCTPGQQRPRQRLPRVISGREIYNWDVRLWHLADIDTEDESTL
jgi:hypothetical protein